MPSSKPQPLTGKKQPSSPNPVGDDFDPELESKEARRFYRQCQKCWKRKADGVKLSVCSSCKITSYCSVQCQKADWPRHKEACRSNQERRESMARHDELELMERQLFGTHKDRPVSSEVDQELREFLKRFRPVICQAGYRCLGVQKGRTEAWKHEAFVMRVKRIKKPDPESRLWSRYKVVDAKAVPLEELAEEYGGDMQPLLKQGEVYHEENVKTGCIGTIMTFLNCDSAGRDLRVSSWAGYHPEGWDDDEPCDDWKAALVSAIERGCGRPVTGKVEEESDEDSESAGEGDGDGECIIA